MELIPIVNEKNEIIGEKDRKVVHEKGLFHRAVLVIIFNSKGKILLQKRSAKKKICPLKLDLSVAEHLKTGESYIEAAVRGLREELGIEVSKSDLKKLREAHLQMNEYENGKIKDYEFVELYLLIYDGEIKIDKNEDEEAKFFTKEEVEKLYKEDKLTPWFREEWEFLRKLLL